jgi:hypothetical protein
MVAGSHLNRTEAPYTLMENNMKAYDVGFAIGKSGEAIRNTRRYETEKAQNNFLNGYVAGLQISNPGHWIVQCNREGQIFPVKPNLKQYNCPTCGRGYLLEEDGSYQCDRELKILAK